MPNIANSIGKTLYTVISSVCFAILVYFVGTAIIKKLSKLFSKSKISEKLDPTLRIFLSSVLKMGLYILLFISIVNILGVPTTSIIGVISAATLALGMAMQGALSNFAGGLMLMIFRPFKIGDYIDAVQVSGTVEEVSLFYTIIATTDNKIITVPNGTLMNSNVTNYSKEPIRRVDLKFTTSRDENIDNVESILRQAIQKEDRILTDNSHPSFARLTSCNAQGLEFTVRVWTQNKTYWDVYFDMTKNIADSFRENNIKAPLYKIVQGADIK
jgi:small conductance mechanosensitive channel